MHNGLFTSCFDELTRSLEILRSTLKNKTHKSHLSTQQALQNVARLRDQTLKALSEFSDPYAIVKCVENLKLERNFMTEFVMLSYLEKVAPLRPDIRPKLEEMYNSPTSPLRNHPHLLRVLKAMDKVAAEKVLAAEQEKNGNADENRDRELKDE